jgi:hypothetical protein
MRGASADGLLNHPQIRQEIQIFGYGRLRRRDENLRYAVPSEVPRVVPRVPLDRDDRAIREAESERLVPIHLGRDDFQVKKLADRSMCVLVRGGDGPVADTSL